MSAPSTTSSPARAAGYQPPSPAASAREAAHPAARWQATGARRLIARGLIGLGLLVLLFLGYEYAVSGVVQGQRQAALLHELRGRFATPGFDSPDKPIPSGPIALLEIPRLGLHQVVVQGSSPTDLQQAPGHYPASPLPGEYGNSVILGHRTVDGAPFSQLYTLRRGDEVVTVTGQGRFVYRIVKVGPVDTGRADPIGPVAGSRLTLLTSQKATSSDRLEVVAKLEGRPVAVPLRAPVTAAPNELGTSGDLVALFEAIGWAQVLLIVVVLGVLAFRRWPARAAYLVTVPPVLMLLLLIFQSLDRMLPGTL
ncbi:MAG: sortase [Gaiellales bacterium]